MPEEGDITKRSLGLVANPCTPAQAAANIKKIGDTITNINNQIQEINEYITIIELATCEVLELCEFVLPPDFPPTDPPIIENIIETLWNAISECCGQNLSCRDLVDGLIVSTTNLDYVDSVTLQSTVVTAVTLQSTVVTAVSIDEEECILSVTTASQSATTGSQSHTTDSATLVDDVEETTTPVFVGDCPEE